MDLQQVRERQRKRVKERYYRTIDRLSAARELVQTLEDQHKQAVERHAQVQAQTRQLAWGHRQVLHMYTEAAKLADQLQQEKKALMALVEERERLQHRIITLFDDGASESNNQAEHDAMLNALELPFCYMPMTISDCAQLATRSYDAIQRFLRDRSCVTSQGTVFGWNDRRQMDDHEAKICLQKIVFGFTPFELSIRTWAMMGSPKEYPSFFSASLTTNMRCVQTLDENNVVLYARFESEEQHTLFNSLFLFSRLKIKNGYATLLQSVDRSQFTRAVPDRSSTEEQWIDINMWLMYQEHGNQEREANVMIGGTLTGMSKAGIAYWMLEMLFASMRWENKVVGPMIRLPQQ